MEDDILLDIDLVNDMYVNQRRRRQKVYRRRANPFAKYDDVDFKKIYRFDKETALFIINLIKRDLLPKSNTMRGLPISPALQVLATIRYLAKEAYQQDMGDMHRFSQPTLSLIVKRVCRALARRMGWFIKFPSTAVEYRKAKNDFYDTKSFPYVIGAIDGTHMKIKNPGGPMPGIYYCRKGYYSLNVQVVSDAHCKVLDIVARWRGTAHDSRIWNSCLLKESLEQQVPCGVLLGDNGYACSRLLLTPLLNPVTRQEKNYNQSHISTRNVVERLFGQMKGKFRSLFNGLQISLNTAKDAIIAIAVMRNIAVDRRMEYAEDSDYSDLSSSEDENEPPTRSGNIFRQSFIDAHF